MNPHQRTFIEESVAGQAPAAFRKPRANGPRTLITRAARKRRGSVLAPDLNDDGRVLLHRGRTVGGFRGNATSLVSDLAFDCAKSQGLLKKFLRAAKVPTPRGQTFTSGQFSEAADYLAQCGRPAVLKPDMPRAGRGVRRGISTREDLAEAWEQSELWRADKLGGPDRVLVEEEVTGLDLRAYVVGEQVVAALVRLPLFACGDGETSLDILAAQAREQHATHPLLGKFPVISEDLLYERSAEETTVVPDNEVWAISDSVNMKSGGLTVDVTAVLSSELQNLAVETCWAVPGCHAAAVDILCESPSSAEGSSVIQLDPEASIALHHYPWLGRPQPLADHLAKAMILRGRA